MSTAPLQIQQQQLILRLPDDLAGRVHRLVKEGEQSNKSRPAAVIDVKPQDAQNPSDDFIFVLDEKEYPALLLNLPAPLESHKTFDNKIFLKSSDIGQMLQVFHTEKERDLAKSKIVKTMYGDYTPSGITPPTYDIVKRRFELTRKNESYLPYKIKQVTEEINLGTDPLLTSPARSQYLRSIADNADPEVVRDVAMESVVEEVVDFEEWMADETRPGQGISLTVVGSDWSTRDGQILQQHPEILMFEVDQEEDAIEQLAAEQLRVERERMEALNRGLSAAAAAAGAGEGAAAGGSGAAASGPTPLEMVQAAGAAATAAANEGEASESLGGLKLSLKKKSTASTAAVAGEGMTVSGHLSPHSGHLSPHSNTEDDLKIAAEDEEEEEQPDDAAEGEEQQDQYDDDDEDEEVGEGVGGGPESGGDMQGASAAAVVHMMMEQENEESEEEEEEEDDDEDDDDDLDESMLLNTVSSATAAATATVSASVVEMEEDNNEGGEEQEGDEEGDAENEEVVAEEEEEDDEEDWMKNI